MINPNVNVSELVQLKLDVRLGRRNLPTPK